MKIYKKAKMDTKGNWFKKAQGYSGYYTGDVPEYAVDILGTSSVDASQIKSMFNRVDDAIRLVNQYDSSLLSNVSFIFNFSKSGAYGVYLSELDRTIKTRALKKKLEQAGYTVQFDDAGVLTAYSEKEPKTQDEISADIDRIYQDLESKGGTAFGINMNAVLQSAKEDARNSNSEDPDLWEWMALLHLGGTIVHEAVHAQGHHDEGPSESAEKSFMNSALPIINNEYESHLKSQGKEEIFSPLQPTGQMKHAEGKHWYRVAQTYIPPSFIDRPLGSDLVGRMPGSKGMLNRKDPGWGMMDMEHQDIPIEKRLGRQFMAPLPPGLDQENQSIEEQLRRYNTLNPSEDIRFTEEELLQPQHTGDSYETMEKLLEDERVKPLMTPIKKSASLNKIATLFGWMNNLDLSDGSTIPGLSDRVMAWDDRDESFVNYQGWIRKQNRYNPRYDLKGFYYRWIEPKFHPTPWDDYTEDISNISPARRFASKKEDLDSELVRVLTVLNTAKAKLANGTIRSTRIVASEDVLPLIEAVFNDATSSSVNVYGLGETYGGEILFAVWLYSNEIDSSKIDLIEKGLQNEELKDDVGELVEEILGPNKKKEEIIDKVISTTKDLCEKYGVPDVYLVGGYPRDMVMGNPASLVDDLDFSGAWPQESIKIGGLLAEELGVYDVEFSHSTKTLYFYYNDIKVDFRGDYSPFEIRELMRENGIKTTPLNFDVYNRDFTINMLVYSLRDSKVYDITKMGIEDINNRIIRTFFDADYVCRENPMVILRAIKFRVRYGFDIDPALEAAMIENASFLFDGRYSDDRLLLARESIMAEGKEKAKELFKEYRVDKIEEI